MDRMTKGVNHRHGRHFFVLFCVLILFVACHPKGTRKTNIVIALVEAPIAPPISLTETPLPEPRQKTPAAAVKDGIAYLSKARWEMEFVFLYSYLQRQFEWPDIPAIDETPTVRDSLRRAGDANARNILHEMELFGRLIDPQYRLTNAQLDSIQELDSLTVPSLYCDVLPIDTSTYFPMLRNQAIRGGYQGTHTVLCYVWMKELGCIDAGSMAQLRNSLLGTSRALLQGNPAWNDLNIEAAALLKAADDPIKTQWTKGVIDMQNADGGWSHYGDRGVSNTHTTILALWLLAKE